MKPSCRGMVYLYRIENDALLANEWYYSKQRRQLIVDRWMKKFEKVIKDCYIAIRPRTKEDDIYDIECRHVPLKKQPSLQVYVDGEKMDRPKAKYDNNKSLYGINYDDL